MIEFWIEVLLDGVGEKVVLVGEFECDEGVGWLFLGEVVEE